MQENKMQTNKRQQRSAGNITAIVVPQEVWITSGMDQLKPPLPLDLEARNLSHFWKLQREEFELYSDLSVTADERDRVKILYLVGAKGHG